MAMTGSGSAGRVYGKTKQEVRLRRVQRRAECSPVRIRGSEPGPPACPAQAGIRMVRSELTRKHAFHLAFVTLAASRWPGSGSALIGSVRAEILERAKI